MFASQSGPAFLPKGPPARQAAAHLGGVTIYLGPCRHRPLVLQVQIDALDGGADDDLDDFDDDGLAH